MKEKNSVLGAAMLTLTAFIWGVAFVAQSDAMNYIKPFTFLCCRSLIAAAVLIPLVLFRGRRRAKTGDETGIFCGMVLRGGITCGICLFIASSFQQFGIQYTTVGKAGFITALYIIMVPIAGIGFGHRPGANVWAAVAAAVAGMYLLCINGSLGLDRGDMLVLICAVCFTAQILAIDHFSPLADGVELACVQFFVTGIMSLIGMLMFERPQPADVAAAWLPICFAGFFSSGVGYTLQMVAQKHLEPTVASLIMSLESVFSVIAGWLILGQKMSPRELVGCGLVFAGVLVAQLPVRTQRDAGVKR